MNILSPRNFHSVVRLLWKICSNGLFLVLFTGDFVLCDSIFGFFFISKERLTIKLFLPKPLNNINF